MSGCWVRSAWLTMLAIVASLAVGCGAAPEAELVATDTRVVKPDRDVKAGGLVVVPEVTAPGRFEEIERPVNQPGPPQADDEVLAFDPRTMVWDVVTFGEVGPGIEFRYEGMLLRRHPSTGQLELLDVPTEEELALADANWKADSDHRLPEAWDLVFVLGEDGGHRRLTVVEPGSQVAFQGRVFETRDGDNDGLLEVRPTELVVAEVTNTFKNMVVDEVIDLHVRFAGDETAVITGTHEHPFFVPAVGHYVPLGELEPGTTLRTEDGGEAIVTELTRRQGEHEVFNIEVGEVHNYFVRGAGFDGPGVLVHNKPVGADDVVTTSATRGGPKLLTKQGPSDIFKKVGSLEGKTAKEARSILERQGFKFSGRSEGGYIKFYKASPDGRIQVHIRPNGQVVRSVKNTGQRFDSGGRLIDDHNAGEFLGGNFAGPP